MHSRKLIRQVLFVVLNDAKRIDPKILYSKSSAHSDSVTKRPGQGCSLDSSLAQLDVVLHSLDGLIHTITPTMTEGDVLWRCSIGKFYKSNDVGNALRLLTNIQESCWTLGMFACVTDIVFLSACSVPTCNQVIGSVASWFQIAVLRDLDLILNTRPRCRFVWKIAISRLTLLLIAQSYIVSLTVRFTQLVVADPH